jgi:DNA-binding HxlR family transcriptional regulator
MCFRSVRVVIWGLMAAASASDAELIDRIDHALAVLQGKWKVHLLFSMARGVHRHARLLESLPGTSKKVMIDTLRALERDGLVTRNVFPEIPARVEYSLTPLGWSITEPLVVLAEWAEENQVDGHVHRGAAA